MKQPLDKEPKSIEFYTVAELQHAIRTQPADRKRVFKEELERRQKESAEHQPTPSVRN